jgi:hypothetical protein
MLTLMALVFGASMAADTVLEIRDAFLQMLCADLLGLMFVAAVAGESTVAAARMAVCARDLMIAFEDEESVVLEGGRLPVLRRVAWDAIGGCIPVHRIDRCGVAVGANPAEPRL